MKHLLFLFCAFILLYPALNAQEAAPKQQSASMEINLATSYATGDGVEIDYKKALKLYKKAEKKSQGFEKSLAQYNIGLMYYNGEGMKPNYKTAMKWFKKAVLNEDPYNIWAADYIADMYATGKGVKEDKKEALNWYKKTADKGSAKGAYEAGMAYLKGIDTEKDIQKGILLVVKAAKQGHPKAQRMAGLLYLSSGSEEGLKQGLDFIHAAAKQGDEDAIKDLQEIMALQKKAAEKKEDKK